MGVRSSLVHRKGCRSLAALDRDITAMQSELRCLVREAKQIARRYRELTGKPLGITGEIGELEAARLPRLELAPARTPGYDAMRRLGRRIERLQIKTRGVAPVWWTGNG